MKAKMTVKQSPVSNKPMASRTRVCLGFSHRLRFFVFCVTAIARAVTGVTTTIALAAFASEVITRLTILFGPAVFAAHVAVVLCVSFRQLFAAESALHCLAVIASQRLSFEQRDLLTLGCARYKFRACLSSFAYTDNTNTRAGLSSAWRNTSTVEVFLGLRWSLTNHHTMPAS